MESIKRQLKKNAMPYLFVVPSLVLLSVFMIAPLFYSFYISLFQWDGILKPVFKGFQNYKSLFKDPALLTALGNNFKFSFFTVLLTVVIGFLFAVAIERRLKGWKVYKFVYFLPVMLSLTVVGALFTRILEPSFGMLNSFLGAVGLEALQRAWLGNPKIVIYSIIGVSSWQYCGFTMILFLTAMEEIPEEIHDAATLDGVTGIQRILFIIFPSIKRVFYVVTMAQLIFTFKVFDIVWVMTKGGPGGASEVLGTLMYRYAFDQRLFGRGAAVSIIMFVIISVLSLVYIKFSKLGSQEIS